MKILWAGRILKPERPNAYVLLARAAWKGRISEAIPRSAVVFPAAGRQKRFLRILCYSFGALRAFIDQNEALADALLLIIVSFSNSLK